MALIISGIFPDKGWRQEYSLGFSDVSSKICKDILE